MKPFIIALTLCLFVNISSCSTNDAPIVEPPNGETAGDSNTSHVERCMNQRGPPRKAKY